MTEAELVWIDQGMMKVLSGRAAPSKSTCARSASSCWIDEGRVTSTNARARELLRADSQPALNERVRDLQRELTSKAGVAERFHGRDVRGAGGSRLARRSQLRCGRCCERRTRAAVEGRTFVAEHRRVFFSRRRVIGTFSFLSRDWAHDLKGMLHVIRINSAIARATASA